MASSLEEIAEIISYLHDGVVEAFALEDTTLVLKVRIRYLAQRIDPSYETLTVRLHRARQIAFTPWWDDQNKKTVLTDLNEVLGTHPWILGAGAEHERIEILTTSHATELEYSGGLLSLLADGIEMFDPSGKPVTAGDLAALSDAYWDEFAKRKPGASATELN